MTIIIVCPPWINNNEEAKHHVNSKRQMAASHLSTAVFFLGFAYTTNRLETRCSMSSREAQQLPLHWPQAAGLLQSEIAFNRRLLTHFYQLFHVQHEINRVLFNIRSLHNQIFIQ